MARGRKTDVASDLALVRFVHDRIDAGDCVRDACAAYRAAQGRGTVDGYVRRYHRVATAYPDPPSSPMPLPMPAFILGPIVSASTKPAKPKRLRSTLAREFAMRQTTRKPTKY